MRGRRSQAQIENIFHKAFGAISEREDRVMASTVSPAFSLDDVIRWMFTENTISKLKAAFPIADGYESRFMVSNFPVPFCPPLTLNVDTKAAFMCTPKSNMLCLQLERGGPIIEAIKATAEVHEQFNKVRKVIRWFGAHNVTPGAARYYWPTILTLLPSDHAAHETDGERYRPVTGIQDIIPLLRETSGIVAASIMAPPIPTRTASQVTVAFTGPDIRTFTLLQA